jgi:hypothetical protein
MSMFGGAVKFWNLGHDAAPSIHQQVLADKGSPLNVPIIADVHIDGLSHAFECMFIASCNLFTVSFPVTIVEFSHLGTPEVLMLKQF